MYLTGLGTAVPEHCFTQVECWAAMQESPQFPALSPRSHAVLRKVLTGENGIATRHLAVSELSEAFVTFFAFFFFFFLSPCVEQLLSSVSSQ